MRNGDAAFSVSCLVFFSNLVLAGVATMLDNNLAFVISAIGIVFGIASMILTIDG